MRLNSTSLKAGRSRIRPSSLGFRVWNVPRCCSTSDGGVGDPEASQQQSSNISDAIIYSLSEVARISNRVSNSTNLFLVSETEESWRKLDKKVNKYPIQRQFTAIGKGGQVFKESMIKAVEDVVGPVHVECISERASSKGSYISITVGPVWVESCDQIIEIYARMKEVGSENIKWII